MKKVFLRCLAVLPMAVAGASSAFAAGNPIGTWIDHTGRGAVEITDCGGALCGRIVWLKSDGDQEACGMQVIGNAKPVAGGKWDGGWIYDPEAQAKYDVELTPIGEQKLKVLGYAGMKMLGETMTWTRAPADLRRCDATPAERPPARKQAADPPTVAPKAEREADAVAPPRGRAADAAPATGVNPPRQAKECGIKIEGLGELTFPCLR
jgi:uncharacterized protein (DUF2147 family)